MREANSLPICILKLKIIQNYTDHCFPLKHMPSALGFQHTVRHGAYFPHHLQSWKFQYQNLLPFLLFPTTELVPSWSFKMYSHQNYPATFVWICGSDCKFSDSIRHPLKSKPQYATDFSLIPNKLSLSTVALKTPGTPGSRQLFNFTLNEEHISSLSCKWSNHKKCKMVNTMFVKPNSGDISLQNTPPGSPKHCSCLHALRPPCPGFWINHIN